MTYHLLIDEVSNEASGGETDLFIISPVAFLEAQDQTPHNQLSIVRELKQRTQLH